MGQFMAELANELRAEREQTLQEVRARESEQFHFLHGLLALAVEADRCARRVVADNLEAAGYHRPKRGAWRRKR